jgi:hypothetical protein
MLRVRALLTLLALVPMARVARAQPVDPYSPAKPAPPVAPSPAPPVAPSPAPAAPGRAPVAPEDPYAPAATPAPDPAAAAAPVGSAQDPVLAERVAQALVTRAQELLDTGLLLDAKQLAVEALVGSPKGSSADKARAIIHAVNLQLGIPEDSPKPDPTPAAKPSEDVDTSPIQDPTLSPGPIAPPPEGGKLPSGRLATSVHGGLYAGLLGATIGSFFSDNTPAKGAVPVGLAAGVAGAFALPRLTDKLHWSEAEVRTVGAATNWGGVIGGLFGDVVSQHTTAREVLVSASIGSTLAGLGGYAYMRTTKLTRGDVALVDTLAGIGAAGGLTLGMVMQPAQSEAYSLNAVLGIAGGVAVGLIAAPQTNTTPRRMLRVAGLAALGGATPFLLYAAIHTSSSTADERVTGLLSTGGLVVGAYLGLRFTRGMDDGLDTLDGKPRKEVVDDAPIALVGRTSAGRWGLGGLGVQPLSPVLAPQHGVALQLLGAAF